MKQLNLLDLATILQLNEKTKENLKNNFDNYDDVKKADILNILWDGVFELKERLAKIKYEEFLLEVDEGKRELTTDMYDEATKAAWQDLEDMLSGKFQDLKQLEEVRAKLQ